MDIKKKLKVVMMVAAVFLCGIIYLVLGPGRGRVLDADVETGLTLDAAGSDNLSDAYKSSEINASEVSSSEASSSDGASNVSDADKSPTYAADDKLKSDKVYIYICGEVKNEGVYTFDHEPRVAEVVDEAGGFTKKADKTGINLAKITSDGEQITVYKKGKKGDKSPDSVVTDGAVSGSDTSGRIDINTATVEELKSIPGIGDAKASAIVSFREENGLFKSTEDLMKITGIKQGIYNRMKDYIRV